MVNIVAETVDHFFSILGDRGSKYYDLIEFGNAFEERKQMWTK